MKLNYTMGLLSLFVLLTYNIMSAQPPSDKKFLPDNNVSKYISKRNAFKTNAAFISASSYILNKTIEVGYQRRITNWYWGEIGFSLKGKEILTDEYWADFVSDAKYGVDVFVDQSFDYVSNQRIKKKYGAEIGLYRTIVGLPPVNSVSYGVVFKKEQFDHSIQVDTTTSSATMNTFCVFPTLIYKTNIVGNLGFDINVGIGPAFISHAKTSDANNMLSGLKYTKIDYNFALKFFYCF